MATALDDIDLDEEIKRQKAIAALLEAPEAAAQRETDEEGYSASAEAATSKKDTGDDWKKWPSINPEDLPDLSPPPPPNLVPEVRKGEEITEPWHPAGVQTDTETGTRYVTDADTGLKVPYAEAATPEDKAAFRPSDVTLPKIDVTGNVPVRRAELIDPDPDAQYLEDQKPVPAVPGFVEGSQNAIISPQAGVIAPTPPPKYPGQIVTPEEASGKTSLVNPVQPVQQPSVANVDQVKPAPVPITQQPAVNPVADDWRTWTTVDGTPAEPQVAAKPVSQGLAVNPDGTPFPERIQAVGGKDPVAIIIHHTGDHHTAAQTKAVLDERGLGVELTVDRQGNVVQIGNAGAANIKTGWGPKGTGLNNSNIIGIEVAANDDGDVLPIQVQAVKNYLASAGYGNTPVYGHGEVNPGHKEADEGMTIVNSIRGDRESGKVTSTGEPGTTPIETLVKLDSSGLNVTHYGYQGDEYLDKDSAAGRGAYVENLIPGYDVALNAQAAHLVGDPKPGETFQFAGKEWRYGDKVPERYSDARFDIYDKDGNALTGSVPVGKTAAAEADTRKADWESWPTLSAADEADIQTQKQQKLDNEGKILTEIDQRTPNRGAFWKILNSDVAGVSPQTLTAYRDKAKQQITDYAYDYYNGPNEPVLSRDDAFKRAISDPDLGTYIGEVFTKIMPNIKAGAMAFSRSADDVDQNRVNQFMSALHPEMTPEKRVELKRQIMAMPREERAPWINALLGETHDPAIQATLNPIDVADSFDRISDPVYQAKWQAAIKEGTDDVARRMRDDPRIVGTPGAMVTKVLAAMPKNIMEATSGAVGRSAMLSEIYYDSKEQLAKEHPDWSEEKLREVAGASTAGQAASMELINLLTGGLLSGATRGITQPLVEFAARLGLHGTTAGLVGGVQQISKNAIEGRNLMDGVQEAIAANSLQGAIGAGLAGRAHPAETAPRTETTKAEIPPPVAPERPPVAAEPPPVATEPPPTAGPKEAPIPPPVAAEPPHTAEVDEETINQKAEDIYNRKKAVPIAPPVEVTPSEPEAPIRRDVQEPEPARPDVGGRTEPDIIRPPVVPGGQVVPPELGRVQRSLESKLSSAEVQRFQPLVDALYSHTPGTPEFKSAYVALREAIYNQHYRDLFEAGGITRTPGENPFAANYDRDGNLSLITHDGNGSEWTQNAIHEGAHPVEAIHSALNEELTHHAHNLVLRDEWQAAKASGEANTPDFHVYKGRRNHELLKDFLRAQTAAEAKGNHKLAIEMQQALQHSMEIYRARDPRNEPQWFQNSFDTMMRQAQAGDYGPVSRMVMELTRQLSQLKRGDFTENHFQRLWGEVKGWYQKAVDGLRKIQARLGPGHSLAKTQLSKMIRGIEAKLAELNAKARPVKPETLSEAAARARAERMVNEAAKVGPGGVPVKKRRTLRAAAILKGGEDFYLDHEATKPIADSLRRLPSDEQRIAAQAKIHVPEQLLGQVPREQRARVAKEYSDYIKAEQSKQPLPTISADTQGIINAIKDSFESLGKEAKALDVHVQSSEGKIRPIRLIGRDYFPRRISADTRDMFNNRDAHRAADFDALVNQQIGAGKVKSRDEFIDKFTHAITPDLSGNGFFGNLEKAREAALPQDFYDTSLETALGYLKRTPERLAQIQNFGQKFSPRSKDVFDVAGEHVNKMTGYTHEQKQIILNRIEKDRGAVYKVHDADNLEPFTRGLRTAAGGLMLGNPITSLYNAIGGAAQNLTFGGPGTFLRTAKDFTLGMKMMGSIKEARERGILKHNFSEILDDYNLATNQGWLSKGVQGVTGKLLKYNLQNFTEGVNRAFAMQQAKYLLNQFARVYGQTGTRAKSLYEMIQRKMPGVDLHNLMREKGQGPLSDEFIRQYALDVHGSYGPGQASAALFDHPAGRVILQFQKWGANTQRLATREFIAPMARAAASGDKKAFVYHLLRNVGYLATGTASGVVQQEIANWLKGKDSSDPSIADIYKRFAKGDTKAALMETLHRAWGAFILSGFAGSAGNYADMFAKDVRSGRTQDPFHPPGLGVLQPWHDLAMGWFGENHFQGPPSPGLTHNFAASLSSLYRVGSQIVPTKASQWGGHTPWGDENMARNNLSMLRSRVHQFEDDNPEYQKARQLAGSRSMQMTGRGEFDPYRDRIQAALLTGHPEAVQLAIADWLDKFAPGEQKERLKSIRSSIAASSPIRPGGSSKFESELQFLQWAKEKLPEDEARRIFATAQTYARTAIQAGVTENKTLRKVSGVDYDSLPALTAVATPDLKAVKVEEPEGEQVSSGSLARAFREMSARKDLQNR